MYVSIKVHFHLYKIGYRGSKENYRPVNILPVISKSFEKLLCNYVTPFMDQFLSKYQCDFPKEIQCRVLPYYHVSKVEESS